ncbi:LytR C-terminal domain-containing protein [Nocardioides sp. BP30]|uniref:LytR C-terminal domain-containing protein n=1 Tax=Nocardioides sp. BP30 TaxID=3036374 RepID=UPI0024695B51|nr:LytR C-terminal domain-containing protein [Nocardioides sp. BP30]WGL52747.1 LytR C-terminal domain-containing protein [Nocardioides sp. BP30]
MLTGARTLLTLVVVALLVVVIGGWGFALLTKPFPKKADAPVCSSASVNVGDHVFPAQVTVSVLNASKREGLAGRTMTALKDGGFAEGHSGNAASGTKVGSVQIWTEDPASPAVKLVAAWLPGAKVVRKSVAEPGVVVVVGDKFGAVGTGPKSITAATNATICSPTLS